MLPFFAKLTATALGELCAGGVIAIGGVIGLLSLLASPERRGRLFHGKHGRGTPVSRLTVAAWSGFLLIFGGSLVIAGLTDARVPEWVIGALAGVMLVLAVLRFVESEHDGGGRNSDQTSGPKGKP